MKFVDAHIHLSDKEYNGKVETIIEAARKSNVTALVSNSMDYESSMLSLRLAEQNLGLVFAALGIHPRNIQFLSSKLRQLFRCKLVLSVSIKRGK